MSDENDPSVITIEIKDNGQDGIGINYKCNLTYFKKDKELALDIVKTMFNSFREEMEKRGLFIHSKVTLQ